MTKIRANFNTQKHVSETHREIREDQNQPTLDEQRYAFVTAMLKNFVPKLNIHNTKKEMSHLPSWYRFLHTVLYTVCNNWKHLSLDFPTNDWTDRVVIKWNEKTYYNISLSGYFIIFWYKILHVQHHVWFLCWCKYKNTNTISYNTIQNEIYSFKLQYVSI